jgi:N-methylhydantoinase A
MILGVDTGGTFTDFVLFRDGALREHKVLSTPDAPEQAILQGVRDLGLEGETFDLVHGSTVATNAVLEGKGGRVVLITNRGLADMLTIGRQAREHLYDLQPEPPAPPVPPEHCLEVGGRLAADGAEVESLDDTELQDLADRVAALKPDAVAVVLLFSFVDDRHEQAVGDALPDGPFLSLSSQVLPEYREYERGMATFLNAYVGPLVLGYLQRLQQGLGAVSLSIMQSSGGTIDAAQAGEQAVKLLLSGPAGGLTGARVTAASAGCRKLLSFDMGGTSTDVALIDGEPRLTTEGFLGRFPVAVPMVDMHTIGAGGGSIAAIDAGGMLQVGPESAGAKPGPACYGKGGVRPTVTDANVVIGRLLPDAFLGGAMTLDRAAAERAVGSLAQGLGLSPIEAARGILRVANEHMARALRVISIERGVDPRGHTLVSFGGAGGLHVCALADALGMGRAMVPVHAGVLSALGMIAATRSRQLSHTLIADLAGLDDSQLEQQFDDLHARAAEQLVAEGVVESDLRQTYSLDLRYRGQSFTLNLPWAGLGDTTEAFHRSHEKRYGHRLDQPVELVNLRVGLQGPPPPIVLRERGPGSDALPGLWVRVHGDGDRVPVYLRDELAKGQCIDGPALITETVSTTWLASGWCCEVEGHGNLMLSRVFHYGSP